MPDPGVRFRDGRPWLTTRASRRSRGCGRYTTERQPSQVPAQHPQPAPCARSGPAGASTRAAVRCGCRRGPGWPASTVRRVLRQHGLNRPAVIDRPAASARDLSSDQNLETLLDAGCADAAGRIGGLRCLALTGDGDGFGEAVPSAVMGRRRAGGCGGGVGLRPVLGRGLLRRKRGRRPGGYRMPWRELPPSETPARRSEDFDIAGSPSIVAALAHKRACRADPTGHPRQHPPGHGTLEGPMNGMTESAVINRRVKKLANTPLDLGQPRVDLGW